MKTKVGQQCSKDATDATARGEEDRPYGRFAVLRMPPSLEYCLEPLEQLKAAGRDPQKLIVVIHTHGREASTFLGRRLFHTWLAARALATLHEVVPHGRSKKSGAGWKRYVEDVVGIPIRTARRWMEKAAKYPTFEAYQRVLKAKAAVRAPIATSSGGGSDASSVHSHERDSGTADRTTEGDRRTTDWSTEGGGHTSDELDALVSTFAEAVHHLVKQANKTLDLSHKLTTFLEADREAVLETVRKHREPLVTAKDNIAYLVTTIERVLEEHELRMFATPRTAASATSPKDVLLRLHGEEAMNAV